MSEAAPTLTMPGYLPRIVGREVEDALRRRGAVLVEGVRGCKSSPSPPSAPDLLRQLADPARVPRVLNNQGVVSAWW